MTRVIKEESFSIAKKAILDSFEMKQYLLLIQLCFISN